jgi:FtsP/CotA-like multicopper oxidase with cupredoxin domain
VEKKKDSKKMLAAENGLGPDGTSYTQNRATLHLHGGNTPWISDGTPHQWITPAGETSTTYTRGVSQQNVPDMWFDPITHNRVPAGTPGATNDPGPGSATFYYTNQQSCRLMFYHDHAYGITRLNVYVGEAAGYLLTDPAEHVLINGGTISGTSVTVTAGTIPADQIPLIIQDKTFVDATQIAAQDPTWNWGTTPPIPQTGDLWFPHVYMPNQWPDNPDLSGTAPMGRWDYGPWFWPPLTAAAGLIHGEVPNPYYAPGGTEPLMGPGTPNPSLVPEAFMDTPVINGTPYPYITLQPKAYRFRILNACNDRFLNLQLYYADTGGGGKGAAATATVTSGSVTGFTITNAGTGYVSAPNVYIYGGGGSGAAATAIVSGGAVTSITLTSRGIGYTSAPTVTIGSSAEVRMVPAVPHPGDPTWPATWPTDGRNGGVPDPNTAGPAMIQIGTEGGFLPAPAVLPNTPIGYEYFRRSITVLNVSNKTLFLGPAERADVIVDFSKCTSGSKLILYNDAPAPVPAFDPRYDYYTGDPDQSLTGDPATGGGTGGAPATLPGYGPNTRTIMQIRVSGTASAPYSSATLTTALPAAYAATQPPPIVPEAVYGPAYSTTYPDTYARIQDTTMTFTPAGAVTTMSLPMQPKAIQELFELNYGRLNATLGVELPFTNVMTQTTIPYGYIDPPTEIINASTIPGPPVAGDGTQLWKITHNGVDTHAIHVHLFNAQLVNRVGWDGMIKPPDPNEVGWKETIRMIPLEDVIVALRPTAPGLPFLLPDSVRPLDVTMPLGSTMGFAGIDPKTGNPVTTTNTMTNFGWEYVWHCHLLGHEENDMMRPIVFTGDRGHAPTVTATVSPAPNAAGWNNSNVTVTITAVDYLGGTGIASITYSASGAQPIASTTVPGSTTSFAISTEGVTAITYYATDNLGINSPTPLLTIRLDKTAPTLTWGAQTPPANSSGWNNTPVNIPYTTADNLSGVASATPVSPLSFTLQGANQTRVVTVVERAGNTRPFTSPAVNIDLTPPTVTAATNPSSVARGTGTRNVMVSGRVTDTLSGVDTRTGMGSYSIVDSRGTVVPSGTFAVGATGTYSFTRALSITNTGTTPRTYTITVRGKDRAGNTGSAVATFVVR